MSKKKRLKGLFFHWVTEPTPQNILCHLHEKTEGLRTASGFLGDTNPMEKQLIEHVAGLRQQILVLTDVVQALLIIEDERTSQKARRAVRKLREKIKRYWHKAEQSVVYKILAFVSAVATLVLIIKLVIWFFHSIKK